MNRFKMILAALGILTVSTLLFAQQTKPENKKVDEDPRKPISVSKDKVKFKYLVIDRKAREIQIQTTVVESHYALEFLLCKEGLKDYESVLSTKASPWQLHAGLLMLGLDTGMPAEIKGGKYIPPRGAKLDLIVKWIDKKGKSHEMPVTDWMKLSGKGESKKKPDGWTFIGSLTNPDGSYWADSAGGIITVANVASAVIDVPMKSTNKLDSREYMIDTTKVPAAGTKVTLIVRPRAGEEKNPYARAFLDIDAWGRMKINGEPIEYPKLKDWAYKFSKKHKEASVVLRSSGRSMSCWVPMAELELKIGGIYYFDRWIMPSTAPLMPLTRGQLKWMMDQWNENFREAVPEFDDPAKQVEDTLRQIELKRQEIEFQKKLLAEYEAKLKKRHEKYKARIKAEAAKKE